MIRLVQSTSEERSVKDRGDTNLSLVTCCRHNKLLEFNETLKLKVNVLNLLSSS